MIRTQIQLEARHERAIKRIARRDGISMAEVIRRCVDAALAAEGGADLGARYSQAARLVGAFTAADRAADVAANHDGYLDEAFG
jgi:predicted DNA-binding ribbon-helix-helix protein